jgi:hypothetical protein
VNAEELEHVIRAAAKVTQDEIVVVGSQAVLGEAVEPPSGMLESMEADLYPRGAPARAIEIDGVLGDGSPFHEQFGYYGHGVGPETPVPPAGWESRLRKVVYPANELWKQPAIAWFLEVHDLVLAKLAAGRPKDIAFTVEGLRSGLVDLENLRRGVELMPESHRERTRALLEKAAATAGV